MNKYIKLLVGIIFIISIASAEQYKIVANVKNHYTISNYDVSNKIKFDNVLTEVLDNYKSNNRQQTLKQLIVYYLLKETAIQYQIDYSDSEFQNDLNTFLQSANISQDQLLNIANKYNLDKTIFHLFLKDELYIEKIKQILIYQFGRVSESEINQEVERMLTLNNTVEYEIAQISIYTTTKNSKELIYKIYDDLQNGKAFSSLASSFSQDLYASNGGNVGFIPSSAFTKIELDAIKNTVNGSFTKPLLNNGIYRIYQVKNNSPILSLDPNNPQQVSQLINYVQQKIVYEKGQVQLDSFIDNLLNNTSIIYY